MKLLFEKYRLKLSETPMGYIREIHNEIAWDDRLLAIMGARGVGKSTLILQHILKTNEVDSSLYVSADDLWFTEHSLYELADKFFKEGGKHLYIDEIHKYKNWSREIKNIYDTFSQLKVVYTGSSILDIQKGNADLSRRVMPYKMYGLSFREFLTFGKGIDVARHSLEQIINHEIKFPYKEYRPLQLFKEYLRLGYYPFFKETGFYLRLTNVVNRVLEVDIPVSTGITISTVEKLKKLLYIIIQSVPFKPNYTKIGNALNVSRNDVSDLIEWLGRSELINILREKSHSIGSLGKVDKIYLANTNLSYALSDTEPDIGNIRETVFLSLVKVTNNVVASKESDFRVGDFTFEVGGKNKKHEQIKGIENSYVVKDDIEYGYGNELPLWTFGLLY